MTLMEMLGEIDPLKEVAKKSYPYWKQSKDTLKEIYAKDPDEREWTGAVKHEYCPYEMAGRWGMEQGTYNTLIGYTFNWKGVRIEYLDMRGKEKEIKRSWQDFAREIGQLIWGGEYE